MHSYQNVAIFRNKDTDAQAFGLAVDDSNAAYYFSMVGPTQSSKSIWAGLTKKGKATVNCRPWNTYAMHSAGPGMKRAHYRIPNSSYTHVVCRWTDPSLILVINETGRNYLQDYGTERDEWLATIQEEVDKAAAEQLYWHVATHTDAPVMPEWTMTLWDYAKKLNGLMELDTYGDCAAGYVIREELINKMSWLDVVALMIQENAVTFGDPNAAPTTQTQEDDDNEPSSLADAMTKNIIAMQNDDLRQNGFSTVPGQTVITSGIAALGAEAVEIITAAVRGFSDFNPDNDPYGEHDCATLTVPIYDQYSGEKEEHKIIFKIDYYSDNECQWGSEDPSNLKETYRVMTIMLASDY